MDRRHFVKTTFGGITLLSAFGNSIIQAKKDKTKTQIALIKISDRKEAVEV